MTAAPYLLEYVHNFHTAIDARHVFETEILSTITSRTVPTRIYHYTNDKGLYGILSSASMRLSDVFAQNDTSEIEHGLDTFLSLGNRYASRTPSLSYLIEGMRQQYLEWGIRDSIHMFCACFSTQGDDLSQWRAYADNGKGFSLCFDRQELATIFGDFSDADESSVFQVSYDGATLEKIYEDIWNVAIPLWNNAVRVFTDGKELRKFRSHIGIDLFRVIFRSAVYFKHSAFSAEEETRFLKRYYTLEPRTAQTSLKSYAISRHIDFPIPNTKKRSLLEIRIGPDAGKHTEKFVNDMKREFEWNARVVKSSIPYRSFR